MSINRFSEIQAIPEYIDPFDTSIAFQMLSQRQLDYDKGLQQAYAIKDQINNLDIAHQGILAKAKSKAEELNKFADVMLEGDFSDPVLQRQFQSAMSSIYNDDEVARGLADTKHIRNWQKQLDELQKKGEAAAPNVRDVERRIENYLQQAPENASLGKLVYTPYTDVQKQIIEELSKLPANQTITIQDLGRGVGYSKKVSELTAADISAYVKNRISNDPVLANQNRINFQYDYELGGSNPTSYRNAYVQNKRYEANSIANSIYQLELDKKSYQDQGLSDQVKKTEEMITLLQGDLKEAQKYINVNLSDPKQREVIDRELTTNPDMIFDVYSSSWIRNLADTYNYRKELDGEYISNPLTLEEEKAKIEIKTFLEKEKIKAQFAHNYPSKSTSPNPNDPNEPEIPSGPTIAFGVGDEDNKQDPGTMYQNAAATAKGKALSAFEALINNTAMVSAEFSGVIKEILGPDYSKASPDQKLKKAKAIYDAIAQRVNNGDASGFSPDSFELQFYNAMNQSMAFENDLTNAQTQAAKSLAKDSEYKAAVQQEQDAYKTLAQSNERIVFDNKHTGKKIALLPLDLANLERMLQTGAYTITPNGSFKFTEVNETAEFFNRMLLNVAGKNVVVPDDALGFINDNFGSLLKPTTAMVKTLENATKYRQVATGISNEELAAMTYTAPVKNSYQKRKELVNKSNIYLGAELNIMPSIVFPKDAKTQNQYKGIIDFFVEKAGNDIPKNAEIVSITPKSGAGGNNNLYVQLQYKQIDAKEASVENITVTPEELPMLKSLIGAMEYIDADNLTRNKALIQTRTTGTTIPVESPIRKTVILSNTLPDGKTSKKFVEYVVKYSPNTGKYSPILYTVGKNGTKTSLMAGISAGSLEKLMQPSIDAAVRQAEALLKNQEILKLVFDAR